MFAATVFLGPPLASHLAAQLNESVGGVLSVADPARMQQLMSGLELTPQQQQRLDQMTAAFSRRHSADLTRAQEMMGELQRIEDSGREIDADVLIELAARYQETLARLLPATQQFLTDVMNVLDTDQRARFRETLGGLGLS
ncbi:MAG: hypothetical protein ACE5FJ_08320 [Gemmatimonadales bacterium]